MESKMDVTETSTGNNNDSVAKNNNEEDYGSPEWAQSLSNLSTPLLQSKLTTLKSLSSTLASNLTAKLASSPSGQSLLHIGPSLSTLPPDLQSLMSNLEPMLQEVKEYENLNQTELIRIVTAGKLIESECRRSLNAQECNEILDDLIASEKILAKSYDKKENPDVDENEKLVYIMSLERVAHTTLHLVHQLKRSSERVTNSLATKNSSMKSNMNGDMQSSLPNMNTPLPKDTEKAQFMMKLAPRIRNLERGIIQIISKELEIVLTHRVKINKNGSTESVQPINKEQEMLILGYLFRSFALLGKGTEAELIFAKVAIMPIVRNKITLGKLDEGGSRGECTGLFLLLQDLICTIRQSWGDVLSLVEGTFQVDYGLNANEHQEQESIEIDLITVGVWVPIATTLMTDPAIKMAIFSPGIASILQANYVALETFLSELASNLLKESIKNSINGACRISEVPNNDSLVEELQLKSLYFHPSISCEYIANVQSRLYKHSMTADFAKKWNLPIYYQLRFGEACARLDKAINVVQREGWGVNAFTGSQDVTLLKEDLGFEVPFFLEVFDILSWLWKDDVFLKPLSHRFLRGSIQIIGRVVSFIQQGIKGEIEFGQNIIDERSEEKNNVGVLNIPPVIDKSYKWNEKIDDVATVSWDLTILGSWVGHDYAAKIGKTISPSKENIPIDEVPNSSEIKDLIEGALVEATEVIPPIIETSWNEIIVNILTTRCSAPLSAVKGVAATYRMTNRPPPTQASPYVTTILRPLKEFIETYTNRAPPQVGSEWKRKVISIVAERYCTAVSELSETVQRTEEALKNRKARRTNAGGMSDGEKVKLQLLLDQREFLHQVKDTGVEPLSVEDVENLISLTKSAESLL